MPESPDAANGDSAGLGARVRDAIREAGIKRSEVARSIGLDPSKLSKSLAGTRKFRVEEISRIAELTDVTTDWLTRGRSPEQPRRTRGTIPTAHTIARTDTTAPAQPGPPGAHDDPAAPDAAAHDAAPASAPAPPADPAEETWMSKGTRNRRRIVARAWELYADRGIDAVRVYDLAEATGLSVSAINYHFRTKTQLLEAALRYSLEIIAATRDLVEPADPVEVLRRFARVHAGVDPTVRRVWSIWIQSWARAVVDERSRLNLTAVYGEWMDLISGVIAAGQRTGQVRPGDTDLMVKSVSVFIDGLGIARSTGQMNLTDSDALELIETFLATQILTPEEPAQPADAQSPDAQSPDAQSPDAQPPDPRPPVPPPRTPDDPDTSDPSRKEDP